MEHVSPRHGHKSSALVHSCCCVIAYVLVSMRGPGLPLQTPLCSATRSPSKTLLRRFLWGDDENVLKLDCGDGTQLRKHTENHSTGHLQVMHLMTVYKLNLKKAIFCFLF